MTDSEFKTALAKHSGQTKKHVNEMFEAFKDVFIEALKTDEKLTFMGIGTFTVKKSDERKGINPQTKSEITIPPRRRVSFTVSDSLKSTINRR